MSKIAEICPEWCKISQANAGSVVRIEKSVSYKDVKNKILKFCSDQMKK